MEKHKRLKVGILAVLLAVFAVKAHAAFPYAILMIDLGSGTQVPLIVNGPGVAGQGLAYQGIVSGNESAVWSDFAIATGTLPYTKQATGPQTTTSAGVDMAGLASNSFPANSFVRVKCMYPYNFGGVATAVSFPFTIPSGATIDSMTIKNQVGNAITGAVGTTLGALVGSNGNVATVEADVFYGGTAGVIQPRMGVSGVAPTITAGPSGLKYACTYTQS